MTLLIFDHEARAVFAAIVARREAADVRLKAIEQRLRASAARHRRRAAALREAVR